MLHGATILKFHRWNLESHPLIVVIFCSGPSLVRPDLRKSQYTAHARNGDVCKSMDDSAVG